MPRVALLPRRVRRRHQRYREAALYGRSPGRVRPSRTCPTPLDAWMALFLPDDTGNVAGELILGPDAPQPQLADRPAPRCEGRDPSSWDRRHSLTAAQRPGDAPATSV